jgi:UbiD family decarboxylase
MARLALALGLPPELELDDLVASAVGRLGEAVQAEYIAPSAAACKQVVLRGAAADVRRFPLPQWPGQLGLALDKALLVTRDPATGAVGISLAELQVLGPRELAVRPRLGGAFERHVAATPAGVPLEVAAIAGNDPVLPLVAASNVPPDDDAYLYASALREGPLLITDCESTELEIPARTEIVLEGFAEVDSRPGGGISLLIHTITHRRDPYYEALRGGWAGEEARLLEQWAAAIRARDPGGDARAAIIGSSL